MDDQRNQRISDYKTSYYRMNFKEICDDAKKMAEFFEPFMRWLERDYVIYHTEKRHLNKRQKRKMTAMRKNR